jgi:amino-acid N-acetyltransferase
MSYLSFERVSGNDPDFRRALASANLPTDDLEEPGRTFFRFSIGKQTIGYGGFETCADGALIRSIVVLPERRGMGEGRALTEQLLAHAADAGVRNAYLLTTDATGFFERLGFERIARSAAPPAIRATRQAAALCPSTAVLLRRSLIRCPRP